VIGTGEGHIPTSFAIAKLALIKIYSCLV